MKLRVYKPVLLLLMALLAINIAAIAQDKHTSPPAPPEASEEIDVSEVFDGKDFRVDLGDLNVKLDKLTKKLNGPEMRKLNKQINKSVSKRLKVLDKELLKSLADIGPQINASLKDLDIDIDEDAEIGAVNEKLQDYERTITKTYAINKNDELNINTQYGDVTVNTWNKNEFKIDIKIQCANCEGIDDKKMLEYVKISDAKEGSTIYLKTSFSGDGSGRSWSFLGDKKPVSITEVNYVVYMPAKNALTINSKYSSITLPDFAGKVTINNSHGSFVAKSLNNIDNAVNVKYGSANIRGFNGGNLNVAYGSLILTDGENLNANLSYGSAKINTIKSSGNINVRYGSGLKIGSLDKSLKNLVINSSYAGVNVGINNSAGIDFDVTVHNGGFKYDKEIVFVVDNDTPNEERGWNPVKNYKGHLGKGNSNARSIVIKARYGSVKFE
ncbi:MAG: hypothetical protein EOP47_24285 [Sphingobacteriaceae bacterium]|nr:MAG: hypothetical protein EOP47_24285 [Sphingobacteriaceae bacterium]